MKHVALALGLLALAACTPGTGDDGAAGGTSGQGGGGQGGGGQGGGGQGGGGQGGSPHSGHASGGSGGADAGPVGGDAPGADVARPSPAVTAIAGELQGAFLQLDCASEEIELQFCLPEAMGKKSVTLGFGGEPGKKYEIVLGVWGVMETVTYRNGRLAGGSLYVGGESGTPKTAEWGFSAGTDTFFLNHFPMCAGEHYTYGIQYQSEPITITGGTRLSLFVRDPDNFINTNHMDSQAADPPPGLLPMLTKIRAMPLQGQYVYIEVLQARAL